MGEIPGAADLVELENINDKTTASDNFENLEETDVSRKVSAPRLVKLRRNAKGFGLKVRGQSVEGGPRWLIDGREYKNLQTVSAVLPQSSAEENGVLVGDKILEINGNNVEGAKHERVQELIKQNGETVDIMIITPGEVKMLDIPASVVIHRSDGSKTSINNPSLLMRESLDSLLLKEAGITEQEQNKSEIEVQIHTQVMEEMKDSREVEENSKEENSLIIDNEVAIINDAKNDNESINQENVNDGDSHLIENQNDLEKDSSETNDNNIEQEFDLIEDTRSNSDNMENSVNNTVDGASAIDNVERDGGKIEFEEDMLIQSDEQSSSKIGECSCQSDVERICHCHEQQTSAKKCVRRRETEIEKMKKQMKIMSSTTRRLKLSPFSSRSFNGLSPYFQVDVMNSERVHIKQVSMRTWKHANQRPTALSVLDPTDAYRLENSEFENRVEIWSSNLSRKTSSNDLGKEEQARDLEMQLNAMYRSLMKNRSKNSKQRLSRYLESDGFKSLSENFIKSNAKGTVIAYLNHGYVH